MYEFPIELRKAYEMSPLSYVYYQSVEGVAVPLLASDGFCQNVGMERERAITWLSTGMYERMHPDDVGVISQVSLDFLNQRGPYDVFFRVRVNGIYILIHGFGQWQTMPDGTKLAVIHYTNITETKEKILSVSESYDLFQQDRVYTDPLTGLPNLNYLREFGDERIRVMRARGKEPCVVFADVYSMQYYNTQYGFREGDKLLSQVGKILRESFPEALLVRGENDHFILLADNAPARRLTEAIEEANETIRLRARGNTSGIRCGLCDVEEGMGAEDALDHARHALRWINNDMTRCWSLFSQAEDDRYLRERYIVEHFDQALENNWIRVYYQGIRRVGTEKVAAAEALARWVDPERGVISPADFIPALQRYHQMFRLDLFMLEQVCKEIPLRLAGGMPLVPVSVNFSRQDFDHADIPETLEALYNQYHLEKYVDKSYFIVEITEQDLALGTEGFWEQLHRIREKGFRLWLDDFGSGYSAINMFCRFRFDLVKFDMELLRHLDDNGGINRIILQGLMQISRKLKVHTLIEGLEDEEQLRFLREIGCELAQGYYYHKPEALERLLARETLPTCESKTERESWEKEYFGT